MKIFRICFVLSLLFVTACSAITPIHLTNTPIPLTAISAYTSTPAPSKTPTPLPTITPQIPLIKNVYSCSKIVDRLEEFAMLPIPDNLQDHNRRKDTDFDANQYFDVLQHISMEKGYTLDYVYFGGGIGGEPLLYARQLSQKPYNTENELIKAQGGTIDDYLSTFTHKPWGTKPKYLDHIVVEDSSDGYFEYAVFAEMIERFYLYWHANYADAHILCDHATREKFITEWSSPSYGIPMSQDTIQKAREADLEPAVRVEDDKVQVQIVIFSQFGGFYRAYFTISRSFPHKVLNYTQDFFAPYQCGILY